MNSLEKEEKEKVKDISISIIKEIMNVELDDKLNENSDNIELCSEDDSSENLEDLKIKDEENKSEIEEELEHEPNNNNLFDYEDKKKKFIKKKEKTDFYEINEDLYIFKDLKRKKIK